MIKQFAMRVNGAHVEVSTEDNVPLLYVLRNELNLKGARFGCGEGYCGACTVILNGRAVQSCNIPISSVMDADITTIESATIEVGGNEKLRKIAQCFINEQAAQCGYCIPGIILSTHSFVENNDSVSEHALLEYLTERNLCRCGTHIRIVKAIRNYLETTGKTRMDGSHVNTK